MTAAAFTLLAGGMIETLPSSHAAFSSASLSSASFATATIAAPVHLHCSGSGLTGTTLSWDAVPYATSYEVYKGASLMGTTATPSIFAGGFLLGGATYTIVARAGG